MTYYMYDLESFPHSQNILFIDFLSIVGEEFYTILLPEKDGHQLLTFSGEQNYFVSIPNETYDFLKKIAFLQDLEYIKVVFFYDKIFDLNNIRNAYTGEVLFTDHFVNMIHYKYYNSFDDIAITAGKISDRKNWIFAFNDRNTSLKHHKESVKKEFNIYKGQNPNSQLKEFVEPSIFLTLKYSTFKPKDFEDFWNKFYNDEIMGKLTK